MKRLRIVYICVFFVLNNGVKGQNNLASFFVDSAENHVPLTTEMNDYIDTLLYVGSICQQIFEVTKESYTDETFNELCSTLDTLKEYKVGGLFRSLTYCEIIKNSVYRNDTVSAFRYLMEFRNFSSNCLEDDITAPFSYGLGELNPSSNRWLSEGELSIRIYCRNALSLAVWYPYDAAVQFAYEAILQTKGLNLMADNFFKFMANELANDKIRYLYRQLLCTQKGYKELDALYRSDWLKYHDEFDLELADYPQLHSMKNKIVAIKDSIFAVANSDYSYVLKFFPQWMSVKQQLSENEIAVEFASVSTYSGSKRYVALVIDKYYEVPLFFNLCDEETLSGIKITQLDGLEKLYGLLWEPLIMHFKNKTRIYFSADGILHTLPIESLFTDKIAYRLTSTRELLKKHSRVNKFNIVAYGGLDYNYFDTISHNRRHYVRGFSSSEVVRGTRDFLKGTLVEVEKLQELARDTHTPACVYKGYCGTEESFYLLEDSIYNVLHIATHGFYYSPEEIEEKREEMDNYNFIDFDGDDIDKNLTYSGLLLSGSNNVLSGKSIPAGYEDGILTAREIADTDLSSIDLVVLSACQTGLGEILSDGVFGLQRGFKKAGVKTIVMSLWKVDDVATQMLMTEFYKNLLGGMSKRESLLEAQRKVRNFKGVIDGEGRDFSNPKYWAGFIMLDGID